MSTWLSSSVPASRALAAPLASALVGRVVVRVAGLAVVEEMRSVPLGEHRPHWNRKKGTEMFYGIPVRVLSVASWFHWSGMLLVSYDHSGCKHATGRYPMTHTLLKLHPRGPSSEAQKRHLGASARG